MNIISVPEEEDEIPGVISVMMGPLRSGPLTHDEFGIRYTRPLCRSDYYLCGEPEFISHLDENGETVIDQEVTSHIWWNRYFDVECIAVIHDVPRDANSGYYALLPALYPMFPPSKEEAIFYRKNLWTFVHDYFEDIMRWKLVPFRKSKMRTLSCIYGGMWEDHNHVRYFMTQYILQFVALMEEKSVFLYIQDMYPSRGDPTMVVPKTVVFFFDDVKKKVLHFYFRDRVTAPTQDAIGIYLNDGHFQHVEYKEFGDMERARFL